jgi:hypothetical protein
MRGNAPAVPAGVPGVEFIAASILVALPPECLRGDGGRDDHLIAALTLDG